MPVGKSSKSARINLTMFAIAILVLFLLTFFSFKRFDQQKKAEAWVTHSFVVKLKIAETITLLKDAESSLRAYLLTKDSTFLKPYNNNVKKIAPSMARLKILLADNPVQVENKKKLDKMVNVRLREFRYIIKIDSVSQEQFNIYFRVGRIVMDDINNLTGSMKKTEDDLLHSRIDGKNQADQKTSDFILVISILSLVFLLFSFFRLRNENSMRRRAECSLSEINTTLIKQNLELEKKNTELASFTYIASHDLKEPLRKIETFASIINSTDKNNFSEKGKGYFDSIVTSVQRMQHLIDSVFMYAKTNISGIDLKDTDLNIVTAEVIALLDLNLLQENAVIEYSGLPVIKAIPEQIQQLFTNLIGNALKYSKTGTVPEIHISASWLQVNDENNPLDSNVWRIDFSDNGIGFDEQYKGKIFHIFQRLHAKDQYSGTGIGLAICKKITENHHGIITAKSTEGVGSVFSVFLPIM